MYNRRSRNEDNPSDLPPQSGLPLSISASSQSPRPNMYTNTNPTPHHPALGRPRGGQGRHLRLPGTHEPTPFNLFWYF